MPPEVTCALRWPVTDLPAGSSFKATARVRVTDTPAEAAGRLPCRQRALCRAARYPHRVSFIAAPDFRAPRGRFCVRTRRRAAFDGSTSKEIHESSTQEERHALARRRRASAGGLVFDLGHGPGGNPAAGTIISNQAAASYTDGQGVDRVSQSNAVDPWCCLAAAFSLASDNTKQASPGSTVYFTHTLTNTGNAADTFKITVDKPANTVGSPASTCDIYIDEDGNGLPDSNTPDRRLRHALHHHLGAGRRPLPLRHRRHGQRPGLHGR